MSTIKDGVALPKVFDLKDAALPVADKRDPKMLEAARAFENQFLRQMVTEMRKTVPKDELIPESMAENIFKEQLDSEYVNKWVDGGGVGLADMIYDQLNERYGNVPRLPPKAHGEMMPLHRTSSVQNSSSLRELFSHVDGGLFLAKRESDGLQFKSAQPLVRPVALHSPVSGLVLQAAALEDGRQMLVVKHDEGPVAQIIHNGRNTVKTGTHVGAGEVLAELLPATDGSEAKVFFGLRKASKSE